MPSSPERKTHSPQLFKSTGGRDSGFSLKEAVLLGQAPDGGLFLPEKLSRLSPDFFKRLPDLRFQDVASEIASHFIGTAIPEEDVSVICDRAFNFEIELQKLGKSTHLLELFHGPTAAFKDFGARFMAQVLSYELAKENGDDRPLTILVATSGDTGSAVADAFLNLPGIRVTVLYPKGKVSKLQEKQLTTYGEDSNIWTLEVDGNFDDCQALVTEAFSDRGLEEDLRLNSANSINIARLLPQAFYYFWAYGQLRREGYEDDVVFSVPSGNFGNLTAGVLAKRMGLPIERLIASTNENNIVPEYLETGIWRPRDHIPTNAPSMDVEKPRNFERLKKIYKDDIDKMRRDIYGTYFTEGERNAMITQVWEHFGYIMDPHSVVAYLGWMEYAREADFDGQGVVLMTAHPAKFPDTVQPLIDGEIPVPRGIKEVKRKKKESTPMSKNYQDFRQFLLTNKDIQ